MTKKKMVNQRTLFDADGNEEKSKYKFIETSDFNYKDNEKDEKEKEHEYACSLLEASNLPKSEQIMLRVLYEKGIMNISEIIQITLESQQREYYVKNEESDKYSTVGIKVPKDDDYDFSDWVLISNIKQILDEKGLRQSWLQQKTQIPQSTMWSILNNEKSVSLENAMKISIVMNMPINSLFSYVSLGDIVNEDIDNP